MISADIPMERDPQPRVPPTRVHPGAVREPAVLTLADASPDIPPPTPLHARPSNLVIAAVALSVAVVLALWIVRKRRK